jgi:hypothetical protein
MGAWPCEELQGGGGGRRTGTLYSTPLFASAGVLMAARRSRTACCRS